MPGSSNRELLIDVPEEHLRSLADWLNNEDQLRGRVQPVRSAPEPGKMGGVVELLAIVLGSGGAGAVLVQSICAWLTRRPEISVWLKDSDGNEFEFSAKSANQNPAEVFQQVSAHFSALRDERSGHEQAGR